jgi:hypothetical protein
LVSLIPPEMSTVTVEVSCNFHGRRRETVSDRRVPNLPGGQKLFDLDHCVSFMERRPHAEDNGPCFSSVLRRIVCHENSVNAAI